MHYHITQEQRTELSLLMRLGYSQRNAALVLGVSPSTICRELQRNCRANGNYHATSARVLSRTRRTHANALRNKLLAHPRLAALVTSKLQEDLSPEQVVGWLQETGAKLRASVQTIYDWLYLHARHLLSHLHCRKGKYRRTREASIRKAFRDKRKAARSIDARPAHILARKSYGHWEGDSVVGRAQSGAIATFVERKSGYLLAALLPDKTAKSFEQAAKRCFAAVPQCYRRTLTLDNGVEMSNYEEMERANQFQIYFAHPYHSWERGTNENTNGLLRFYFPKQMGFAHLTQEALDAAVHRINTRPRKRLGYKTPEAVFKRKW
ncbi:MAG TPA: IS30 family transposase [Candidatus Limnocylindria bacterium]|nr:IS30 family transposase [Candidatus Limnocylindria bacterium]